jgi:hypothetical protein
MSRLHLLTIYDDMTIKKKEEGYVRVSCSLTPGVCGDVRVFWKHRHIVIPARNPRNISGIADDDQCVTMAPKAPFRSSFRGRRGGSLQ